MQLTVLGTANPFPVTGNACSGYLLQSAAGAATGAVPVPAEAVPAATAADARPTALWIDAGSGTLAELQRHIALDGLDGIFISHRHADHTADLLVAYYALRFGAQRPKEGVRVRVFGPEGLAERLAGFLGPDSLGGLNGVFDFTELHGWGDAVLGDLGLAWGPVSHGVPAFGLTVTDRSAAAAAAAAASAAPPAVQAPRGAFTYSGDTGPCVSLVELAEESSTLLCEVGYASAPAGEHVHCTPEDAGRQAAEAGVGTLILTHVSNDLAPGEALARARSTFSGDTRVASSGAIFTV